MDYPITTEMAAQAEGVDKSRIRQVIKELGIEPSRIGRAIVLTKDQYEQIHKRNKQRGPRTEKVPVRSRPAK
jgi:hypothetical protein